MIDSFVGQVGGSVAAAAPVSRAETPRFEEVDANGNGVIDQTEYAEMQRKRAQTIVAMKVPSHPPSD